MPDPHGPSEFGFKSQPNTLPPVRAPKPPTGHTAATASEKLRLSYLTGKPDDLESRPDGGASMQGLEADHTAEVPNYYRDGGA